MSESGRVIAAFLAALLTSLAVTPLVIRISRRVLGLAPFEPGESSPAVPRLGGISILAGFCAGVGLALSMGGWGGTLLGAARYHWVGWIVAGAALFLLGLVDDLRGLGPLTKLVVQTAGAAVVFAAGFRIESFRLPGGTDVSLGPAAAIATIFWVVLVTNAINLIDGLDGLAAGVALLCTGAVAVVAASQGVSPVVTIALALAGSLLGFLMWNFSPARIYLGDSGSQFLGFTLAVISIRGFQKSATTAALLGPALILGLPILDMVLVVFRRGWRIGGEAVRTPGERLSPGRWRGLMEGDREHIHYNLIDLGMSHRGAALVLYATTALFCATAMVFALARAPLLGLLAAVVPAAGTAGLKLLAARRRPAGIEPRPAAGGAAPEGAKRAVPTIGPGR